MKILLINPRMYPTSQPPLGLIYLSSYLKAKGFNEIRIIDTAWENFDRAMAGLTFVPEIVGIQVMTPYFVRALYIAEKVRLQFPDAKLVVGGPHPSADPEHTLMSLKPDFGVCGEGEVTFHEIVTALANGTDPNGVNGIFYAGVDGKIIKNPPQTAIENLDTIPFPDRQSLPIDHYLARGTMHEFGFRSLRATTILTSRGCPYKCIYCARNFGRKVRYRSKENVIEEIKLLISRYAIDGLFIVDDTFTVNRRWTTEFCELLTHEKLGLELAVNSRVDAITPDFIKTLRAAGVVSIAYGVESGNQDILDSLKKGITLEKIEAAVRYANEAGIKVKGYFMIGSPGETLETMRQTLNLARRLPFNQVQFSITTPYPGTELWEVAKEMNLVTDFSDALDNGFFDAGVMSSGTLSPDEIKRFHERYCKPLVYRKIVTSVLRDWSAIPYFITYAVQRRRNRYTHNLNPKSSSEHVKQE